MSMSMKTPFSFIVFLFFAFASVCAISAPTHSFAEDIKERAIDGLDKRDMPDGPLPDDLWANMSVNDATDLMKRLPMNFTSRVYRDIFRNLLLAKSDGFYTRVMNDKDGDEIDYTPQDITPEEALTWLDLRFTKLFEIGAFHEVQMLHKEIYNRDQPNHPEMALHVINLLLSQGKLSEACLDINIYAKRFSASTELKELKGFCDSYLKEDSSVPKETSESAEKTANVENDTRFPLLKNITEIDAPSFLASSLTEKLVVSAAGLIPQINTEQTEMLTPLDLKLFSAQNTNQDQKLCFMIQAYNKYVLDDVALRIQYQSIKFDHDLSDSNAIVKRHQQKKCAVPAWYYQWIEDAPSNQDKSKRALMALKYLIEHSPEQLTVFVPLFQDTLQVNDLTNHERWILGAYIIKNGEEFPKDWKKTVITKSQSDSNLKIRLDWYWQLLRDENIFTENHFNLWLNSAYLPNNKNIEKDLSQPLTLLKTMLNITNYKYIQKNHYEKFFLLTFSRNYVIFNSGLIWNIKHSIENRYAGKSLLLLLHISDDMKPADTYTGYLSLLMDMLDQIGYKEYVRHLIIDTLSVGKN